MTHFSEYLGYPGMDVLVGKQPDYLTEERFVKPTEEGFLDTDEVNILPENLAEVVRSSGIFVKPKEIDNHYLGFDLIKNPEK